MIDLSLWAKLPLHAPLVHSISNIVSANDCANLLLAVGARPIMAQAPQEAACITESCSATVLNLGTPDDSKYLACLRAGLRANELGHPVVIDPVGVGASPYRVEHVSEILRQVHPAILRANAAEVQALLGKVVPSSGVDSPLSCDAALPALAAELANRLQCVVFVSGAEDIITDGSSCWAVRGGCERTRFVTGSGCMLTVLCGAASTETTPLAAALSAAAAWKYCAFRAEQLCTERAGLGRYHMALLDAACTLADRPALPPSLSIRPLPLSPQEPPLWPQCQNEGSLYIFSYNMGTAKYFAISA